MIIRKIIIILLVFCLISIKAMSADIVFNSDAEQKMDKVARETRQIVPLSDTAVTLNKELFRTWIADSIDLNKAVKKDSKRFKRTTFTEDVKKERPRSVDEKLTLKSAKKISIPENLKTVEHVRPMKVIYSEGKNYFKWQKMKEARADKPIDKEKIKQMASTFLTNNSFLQETGVDKVKRIEIRERRINEENPDGNSGKDYLIQQDVVFERMYEDKPVINSKIIVGLSPLTQEILLFKHYNWTPVKETNKKNLESVKISKLGLNSGQDIKNRLENKIKQVSGDFTKAEIRQVIPAWFQSNEGLIPVIAFEIYTEYSDKYSRSYFEVINLAGSDDELIESSKGGTSKPKDAL